MVTNEAIILAGGLGTRLKGILPGIPKSMAPVGGRPFLSYLLDNLVKEEISKVIISVGHLKDHIINYFGYSYDSLKIEYTIENIPLGTGGAIKLALNQTINNDVFVVNGDTFFNPNLREMEQLHFKSGADITLAVKYLENTSRYGKVIPDSDGRITEFKEKSGAVDIGYINGGIYLINRKIIDSFRSEKFSIENDIFNTSCKKLHLQAFESDTFFLDIGIPEDYHLAQALINRATSK
jgi:D-glycero-alpha-D-manno-heptose 1-phosphate guanylyltransferase